MDKEKIVAGTPIDKARAITSFGPMIFKMNVVERHNGKYDEIEQNEKFVEKNFSHNVK